MDAGPDAILQWHKVLYVYENCYTPAIALTKLSILSFYARLFSVRTFRVALYVVGTMVLMWWIAMQFTVIFECTPIDYSWHPVRSGRCINLDQFFLGQAIPNIVTDMVILALPLPMIWKLHLPKSQKLALTCIFSLGALCVATNCDYFVHGLIDSP